MEILLALIGAESLLPMAAWCPNCKAPIHYHLERAAAHCALCETWIERSYCTAHHNLPLHAALN